jgi:hypothetical protein
LFNAFLNSSSYQFILINIVFIVVFSQKLIYFVIGVQKERQFVLHSDTHRLENPFDGSGLQILPATNQVQQLYLCVHVFVPHRHDHLIQLQTHQRCLARIAQIPFERLYRTSICYFLSSNHGDHPVQLMRIALDAFFLTFDIA